MVIRRRKVSAVLQGRTIVQAQNLAFTGQDVLTLHSPLSILGGDDTKLHLQTSPQSRFNRITIPSLLCSFSAISPLPQRFLVSILLSIVSRTCVMCADFRSVVGFML